MNSREWRIQLGYGHTLSRVDDGPRKGRIPREGYIRSCGLCVGNLTSLCSQDPEYRAARIVSDGRGGIDEHKLMNIFMLMTFFMSNTKGHIVEFGCYKGGSALFMAKLAARFMPETRVYAFDTFAGMPETDKAVDLHKAGDFSDVSVESVRELAQSAGLTNIEFIPGQFEDTAPDALARIGKIALAHIDCDIYSGVQFSYDACKPYMVHGGYVIFDDPLASTCLGALEAVEDCVIIRDGLHAEQAYPHMVFRYPPIK